MSITCAEVLQRVLLNGRAGANSEVLCISIQPGEFAPAGAASEPLMILGETSVMHVRVEIDVTDVLSTHPQNKVSIEQARHPCMLPAGIQGFEGLWIPARDTRE